jgi:hypothetical protein
MFSWPGAKGVVGGGAGDAPPGRVSGLEDIAESRAANRSRRRHERARALRLRAVESSSTAFVAFGSLWDWAFLKNEMKIASEETSNERDTKA